MPLAPLHTRIPLAHCDSCFGDFLGWRQQLERARSMSDSPAEGSPRWQRLPDTSNNDSFPLQLPPLREVIRTAGEASRIPPLPTVEPRTAPVSPSSFPRRPRIESRPTASTEDASPWIGGAQAFDTWQPSFSPTATDRSSRLSLATPAIRAGNDYFDTPDKRAGHSSPGRCSSYERRSLEAASPSLPEPHIQALASSRPSFRPIQDTSKPAEATVQQLSSFVRPSNPETKPILRIRQQPKACRACGFGERDRRVIDPPPILALHNPDHGSSASHISIVHTSLWDENGEQDVTHAQPSNRRLGGNLMGNLVSSNITAKDDRGRQGTFFVFTDLSCRTYGRYRLRFSLVKLPLAPAQVGTTAPILEHAMSDVFTVYSAKVSDRRHLKLDLN